jgi:membrane dipeptidase
MRSMWEHERNITDEQALACAETGGVVGIAGGGNFLGENEATLEAMVRPIDHAVELLGPEHVGIGSDFSFDHLDAQAEFASHPDLFRRPTPGTAASTGCRLSTLAPSAPNCSGAAIRRRRSP